MGTLPRPGRPLGLRDPLRWEGAPYLGQVRDSEPGTLTRGDPHGGLHTPTQVPMSGGVALGNDGGAKPGTPLYLGASQRSTPGYRPHYNHNSISSNIAGHLTPVVGNFPVPNMGHGRCLGLSEPS